MARYPVTRSRLLLLLFLATPPAPFVFAGQNTSTQTPAPPAQGKPQQNQPQQNQPQQNQSQYEEPPEEDEGLAPEKYVLNPLESERNIRVGNFYWNKGKYRAAAGRYQRATRYNPSSQEAFFKLGEAEAKLENSDAARSAFQRVVQLAPTSKLAGQARKKLAKS